MIPAAGAGTASGHSDTIIVEDYQHDKLGSQVSASVNIFDTFTINYSDGPAQYQLANINIRLHLTGFTFPNEDFELRTGYQTTEVNYHMYFGYVDSVGAYSSPVYGDPAYRSTRNFERIDYAKRKVDEILTGKMPFPTQDRGRRIGLEVGISGVGYMGGGFSLLGIGGIGPRASTGDDSILAEAASLEESFFEIVVELPPGLSISGHSPYIRQVTLPEPTAAGLALLGWLGLAARRLQRGDVTHGRRRQPAPPMPPVSFPAVLAINW